MLSFLIRKLSLGDLPKRQLLLGIQKQRNKEPFAAPAPSVAPFCFDPQCLPRLSTKLFVPYLPSFAPYITSVLDFLAILFIIHTITNEMPLSVLIRFKVPKPTNLPAKPQDPGILKICCSYWVLVSWGMSCPSLTLSSCDFFRFSP